MGHQAITNTSAGVPTSLAADAPRKELLQPTLSLPQGCPGLQAPGSPARPGPGSTRAGTGPGGVLTIPRLGQASLTVNRSTRGRMR